jgi:hypothetical protein
MPAITLDGNAYTGTMADARNNSSSILIAPQRGSKKPKRAGVVLEAPNGALTLMHRGYKNVFTLEWGGVPEFTRAALESVARRSSSCVLIFASTSYSVICKDGDYGEKLAFTTPSVGALISFWDITMTLSEI